MRIMHEELELEVNKYKERLNLLAKINPDLAQRIAQESLIESGVLNKDSSLKESIGPNIPEERSEKKRFVKQRIRKINK